MENATISAELRIHGRVQGVGYRAWTREIARSLALSGWVRNEPDGSVSARFEGPEADIRRMIARCHEGPRGAGVIDVKSTIADVGASPSSPGFTIMY